MSSEKEKYPEGLWINLQNLLVKLYAAMIVGVSILKEWRFHYFWDEIKYPRIK